MTEMPLMGLLGGSLYGVAEGKNCNLTKKCKVLLSHTINYRQPSVIPTCKHHPPSPSAAASPQHLGRGVFSPEWLRFCDTPEPAPSRGRAEAAAAAPTRRSAGARIPTRSVLQFVSGGTPIPGWSVTPDL